MRARLHSHQPPCRSQVPYEVKDSPIAGKGIFATAPIERGALIWRYVPGESVVEHDEASLRARLVGMAAEEVRDLLSHIYCWDGLAIEILDDAKIWNHSVTPNSGLHPDPAAGICDGVSSCAHGRRSNTRAPASARPHWLFPPA